MYGPTWEVGSGPHIDLQRHKTCCHVVIPKYFGPNCLSPMIPGYEAPQIPGRRWARCGCKLSFWAFCVSLDTYFPGVNLTSQLALSIVILDVYFSVGMFWTVFMDSSMMFGEISPKTFGQRPFKNVIWTEFCLL